MWFYRILLHLYPKSFRAEYAGEMERVFLQRKTNASNVFEIVSIWPEAIFDVVINAIRVHADILFQDLRYTARTLSRSPGFAITAILLAALGIGATTAVFTLMDHALIRALPFPESERLVQLWENSPDGSQFEFSPPNYRDLKGASSMFEDMGAYHYISLNLSGYGQPLRLDGASTTSNLFHVLRVRPALGHLFSANEDLVEGERTLLLSYGLWQAYFGGDPKIIGKSVRLNNQPYTIIGIMPRDFHFPKNVEFWTTIRLSQDDSEDRRNNFFFVIGRLKPAVSLKQVRQETMLLSQRLAKEYPEENENIGITINQLRDQISSRTRLMIKVLFCAAICVLLIACANLANLLLARGLFRQKEIAVRSSLGAGKDRLIRQMLTESLVLAVLGGILGVVAALIALPLLTILVPQNLPVGEPTIDHRVLIFAIFLTVITSIAFGVIPSLRARKGIDSDALREGSRSIGGRRESLRSALVVAEVTISVVLLVGAGLMIRALWRIQEINPGFHAENILTLNTSLPLPKYEKTSDRVQFYSRVLADVRGLPGVKYAAYITDLPMVRQGGIWPVIVRGHPENPADPDKASLRYVTPGFFRCLGIPQRAGRDITESDTADSFEAAVVSESFAQRYWPDQDPLGKRFQFALEERTIVGVVGNIKVRGLERESEPQVYLSYQQVPDNTIIGYIPRSLVIRSSSTDLFALVAPVRRIIQSTDPEQPISDIRTLEEIVSTDTSSRQTQVKVLGAFAAVAFILAAIGIHGLLSFSVAQRNQEIALRMAVGARPNDILNMVIREGAFLAMTGILIGAAIGYSAGRIIEALLVGIKPGDAITFSIAIGLTILMTVAGTLIPAIRAVRINPATAMRAD